MTNVFVTMIVGFVILAIVLLSAGVGFWAWGSILSPTLTSVANMTIPNSTDVDIDTVTTRADTGLYIAILIIILIPVALIAINFLFERERYENSV